MISVVLDDRELAEALERLKEAIGPREQQQALLAAAAPIHGAAQENAPRRRGVLAENVQAEVVTGERYVQGEGIHGEAVAVGIDRDAFHGLFVELGTAHHPATPWLRPAFDVQKVRAIQVARQELGRAVERVGR